MTDNRSFFTSHKSPQQHSGANLAYIGDAVYELLVREYLASESGAKSSVLHRRALKYVSASGQADACSKILGELTEEELSAYKRGRNAPISSSKLGSPGVHAMATGLEALFGYLFLSSRYDRIEELFLKIIEEN